MKSNEIKQVFYCFTMYDNVLKKRVRSNCNSYFGCKKYRSKILKDSRYSHISDIFKDSLDLI